VHFLHSACDFPDDDGSGLFGKALPSGGYGVEVAVSGQFEQQVDVGLVAEAGVERNKGGMVEEELQLDLPNLLVDGLVSLLLRLACQPLLADHLQRSQKASQPMSGYPQIYLTSNTSPNRPLPSFLSNWNS
jgi:hypothetical protein